MSMADRNRDALRLLQSVIGRGLHISESSIERAVRLAEQIIDDDTSTVRDRLRAAEFLSSIVGRAVAAAQAEVDRDGGETGEPVRVIIERRSTHPAIPDDDDSDVVGDMLARRNHPPNSTVVRGIDPDEL